MPNTPQVVKDAIRSSQYAPEPTFEEKVLTRLDLILNRLENLDEKVEAIEIRLADIDLDTGSGYEID